jgi:hypothetical protein
MRRKFIATVALVLAMLATVLVSTPDGAAPINPVLQMGDYAVAIADHQHPARVVTAQDVSDAMVAATRGVISGTNLGLGFNLGTIPGFVHTIDVSNSVTFKQVCLYFPPEIGTNPHVIPCALKATLIWQSSLFLEDGALALVAKEALHHQAVSGANVVAARIGKMAASPTFLAGEGGIARFTAWAKFSGKTTTVSICLYFSKWAYVSPTLESCP